MLKSRIVLAFAIAVMITTPAMPLGAQELDHSEQADGVKTQALANAVVGAWTANFVSVDNPPSFPPIPVLITFTSDGTLIEGDGAQVVPAPPPPDTAQIFVTTG